MLRVPTYLEFRRGGGRGDDSCLCSMMSGALTGEICQWGWGQNHLESLLMCLVVVLSVFWGMSCGWWPLHVHLASLCSLAS